MNESAPERVIPAPATNPENAKFFAAAAEGKLLIGRCAACGDHHFYPRALCPSCLSDRVDWVPAQGTGSVYSYSTLHRGVPVPYTIAYVALDEGVTVLTNLVDCAAAEIRIGQRVRVVFKASEDGTTVPMFTLA